MNLQKACEPDKSQLISYAHLLLSIPPFAGVAMSIDFRTNLGRGLTRIAADLKNDFYELLGANLNLALNLCLSFSI